MTQTANSGTVAAMQLTTPAVIGVRIARPVKQSVAACEYHRAPVWSIEHPRLDEPAIPAQAPRPRFLFAPVKTCSEDEDLS